IANLVTMLHRAQEAETTLRALRRVFPDSSAVSAHPALMMHEAFADEGAANHMRLTASPGAQGVEIFVYGRTAEDTPRAGFPDRQTLAACQAIARRHGLNPARTSYVRQARRAIEAGAFHNDVVAVSHETVLLYHAEAFEDRDAALADIRAKANGLFEPQFVEVCAAAVPLEDAVSSYLFNSQLVRLPGHSKLTLIAPNEVRENNHTAGYVADLIAGGGPIGGVEYVEVRESMRNGGGPACLRLRIVMTEQERASAAEGFFLNAERIDALEDWVRAHYREELSPQDLADPALIEETRRALDALTRILPLGDNFYEFQRN
ncbi:MAG: N-succinylarginine dihydrolase, partial [Hyphomonadaceae bacterium]